MLKIEIPQDREKLEKQIKGLEYLIESDTNAKDKGIHTKALRDSKEALLYKCYLELQSKEFKEDILGYEHFEQPGHNLIIKVNFTWGWLRVYRTKNNEIEWY